MSESRKISGTAKGHPKAQSSGKERLPLKTEGRVVLLDSYSLAFRAFYALPDSLATSSGQITNAVYGLTSMLIKLLADERPEAVIACFDKGEPRFRTERYEEYKAGRAETPDTFRQQLPLIREVLEALKIPIVERDGYEADDLLATLARMGKEEGKDVVIVTGDRDCLQLVNDRVTVMMTRRGISDIIRYDVNTVQSRYGVSPERWIDFAALKGEPSDNLPGVPGVGEKTAAQLVSKYGDIDGVIAHADELTPRLSRGVQEHAQQVRLNRELGRLRDDVPLDIELRGLGLEPWDDEEVRGLFTSLEFRTLYERLRELGAHNAGAEPLLTLKSVSDLAPDDELPRGEFVAVAWHGSLSALCARSGEAHLLPLDEFLKRTIFLADPERRKTVYDAKPLYRAVLGAGKDLRGLSQDLKIAAYLLEPGAAAGYALHDIVRRYLGVSLEEAKAPDPRGKQPRRTEPTLDFRDDVRRRLASEAVAIAALAPVLEAQLHDRGMLDLATTLEFPLIEVLARIEQTGILVDRDYLGNLNDTLGRRMESLEGKVQQCAGETFNVNSHPQLRRILFEKLGLPKTRRIKTGYSTDAAELAKLAGSHPIVDALLEYREVAKLKTGFTESLLSLIDPETGRIHTTYEQATAATGRLSSSAPNLQNIPIRGELGRQIRRAFVAPPGCLLLSADYSQIELRVLAHLSQDPNFLEAFARGQDFHATIAAKVYGVPLVDVTSQMRDRVKQFSYGIAYGMSAYGVSQRLGIELDDAKRFIDAYYAQFPGVKEFLDSQVEQAKIDGFTTTMFGRRRYLPELQSSNHRLRAVGERMALNAPIQGSAADIMKKAMIDVDRALRNEPDGGTMLLTVHDELVFEVSAEKLDRLKEIVEAHMVGTVALSCGLAVELHSGANWAEAHA